MRQSAVMFKAKGLSFEGVVATPDDAAAGYPAVVVCHPHPLFGGNMDNNVVLSVCYGLVQEGIATIRFNFRGVGNSEGEHTKGELEYQEVMGAIDLMRAWDGVDGNRIGLAGYSFGTRVVLAHPEVQKRPKAFALISPSLEALEAATLKKDKRPKLIVTGTRDRLLPSEKFQSVLDSFATPPTVNTVEGADHYWMGMEDLMVKPVVHFFAENLT